jgi:polyisoprenoid-binding protein YceI
MKFIGHLFVTLSFMALPALASASTWKIDPVHSTVGFKIRHLTVSNVTGRFSSYSGVVNLDDREITKSKVNVTIDANSINTNETKRDEHLRSAEFFDTAKYPTITFVSKKWSSAANGALSVTGILTMHGVTREVVLNVEPFTQEIKDPMGSIRSGTSATTIINRKDFGISWSKALDTGGAMIGDEVAIQLEIEMVKDQPK